MLVGETELGLLELDRVACSPLVSSCPNTEGRSLAEQFHLSCLNWL